MSLSLNPESTQCLDLAENQVLAFNTRHLKITCLAGQVWLTDGIGGEDVLGCGQQVEWHTCGKTCIQALRPSKVKVSDHLFKESR